MNPSATLSIHVCNSIEVVAASPVGPAVAEWQYGGEKAAVVRVEVKSKAFVDGVKFGGGQSGADFDSGVVEQCCCCPPDVCHPRSFADIAEDPETLHVSNTAHPPATAPLLRTDTT
jgi:hypothetical protein